MKSTKLKSLIKEFKKPGLTEQEESNNFNAISEIEKISDTIRIIHKNVLQSNPTRDTKTRGILNASNHVLDQLDDLGYNIERQQETSVDLDPENQFVVVNNSTGDPVKVFDNKLEAQKFADKLNNQTQKYTYRVV